MTLALGVAACADDDHPVADAAGHIPLARATTGRNPQLAEVPDVDETVRGDGDPPIVTLDLSTSLHEHRLTGTDQLPGNILIPTTNLNAVPVTAALQAVLSGTDVSLSWNTGTLGARLVTVMNLNGPLPRVVEKICAAAKVFCDYRHGSLELSEKETFVVGLPPVVRAISGGASGGGNSMIETINQLIGKKAQVDEQGGNIIYTTDVEGEDRVSEYLAQLRTGRPLIVLQMYIWEVTLNRENAQGIDWKQSNVSPRAVSSGAVADFLASKGQVQTISNPQVTFVSGASAQLKVGGTTRYISQLGMPANAGSNMVSTDSIDTGLTIDVAGSYENGVVFANLNVALKNLVGLNPTRSGGGTVDLPQTVDEKMSTVLRVRPGDSLVLVGLVTSADSNRAPDSSSNDGDGALKRENHELVMIVKPSIVLFSDKGGTREAGNVTRDTSLPDPVVIDKDGSHALAQPQTLTPQILTPVTVQGRAAAPQDAVPLQTISVAPSASKAPVDKTFMQHGFSSAFDQLAQPSGDAR